MEIDLLSNSCQFFFLAWRTQKQTETEMETEGASLPGVDHSNPTHQRAPFRILAAPKKARPGRGSVAGVDLSSDRFGRTKKPWSWSFEW